MSKNEAVAATPKINYAGNSSEAPEEWNPFASGDIFLMRRPIDGRLGAFSLFGRLVSGEFGFKWDEKKEMTLITFSRNRKGMKILHVDEYGFFVLQRLLYGRRFANLLKKIEHPEYYEPISRAELIQLFNTGDLA